MVRKEKLIVPRYKAFIAMTPDGLNGKKWKGRFGFVSMTSYGQPYGPDSLNEKGLYVGIPNQTAILFLTRSSISKPLR